MMLRTKTKIEQEIRDETLNLSLKGLSVHGNVQQLHDQLSYQNGLNMGLIQQVRLEALAILGKLERIESLQAEHQTVNYYESKAA